MCDLYSLTKLFLLGGYCYQHFHKKTTTTEAPTTEAPTTASCEECGPITSNYSFLQDEIKNLCKGMSVPVVGTKFTDDPCGKFFEITASNAECMDESIRSITLEIKYTQSMGSMRGGLGVLPGSFKSFCVDTTDTSEQLEFSSLAPITGIQIDRLIISCDTSCSGLA